MLLAWRIVIYRNIWPPHVKSWLFGKNSDAGREWGQEEKGTTEEEMAGWYHWLDGRESEWTPGVGDGQGGLLCCYSWGCKESDTTEWLNWTELSSPSPTFSLFVLFRIGPDSSWVVPLLSLKMLSKKPRGEAHTALLALCSPFLRLGQVSSLKLSLATLFICSEGEANEGFFLRNLPTKYKDTFWPMKDKIQIEYVISVYFQKGE